MVWGDTVLNLELLRERPKTVVHCPEQWQAEKLISSLDEQLPGMVYMDSIKWWSRYKDRTCYWTNFFDGDGFAIEYCDKDFFRSHGYRVLEFDEVFYSVSDYGMFEVGACNLTNLFEIGV